MKNNETMNAIVPAEVVTEVAEQATASTQKNSGLRNAAIVGGIMTLGVLAWEFGIKPAGRKARTAWHAVKGKKKKSSARNTSKPAEEAIVVDDVEEQFPIK